MLSPAYTNFDKKLYIVIATKLVALNDFVKIAEDSWLTPKVIYIICMSF